MRKVASSFNTKGKKLYINWHANQLMDIKVQSCPRVCFLAHLCICTMGSCASLSVCLSICVLSVTRQKLLDNNSYLGNRLSWGHQIWYDDEGWCHVGHDWKSIYQKSSFQRVHCVFDMCDFNTKSHKVQGQRPLGQGQKGQGPIRVQTNAVGLTSTSSCFSKNSNKSTIVSKQYRRERSCILLNDLRL